MSWITNIAKYLPGFRGSTSVAPTATAGTSAEDIHGQGYLLSKEKSPRLRGRRKYITYQDVVTNTVIVATGVRYFLGLIANADWTFEPAKDEEGEPLPGAQEVADFVKDVLNDMESSWKKVVRRAARFRFQGFSWQEWTAKKREDGKIGFKDVEPRPCSTIERWDLDEGNSVQGVTQWIAGRPEAYLPRGKALYLVDDLLEDSPEGTGLLRHLVRSAERLRAYEELEELAFETDLRGVPIGRAPLKEMRDAVTAGKMTVEAVKKARAVVDNFVRNKILNRYKGAVLDSETFTAVSPDGGTTPSSVHKWDVELMRGEGGPHNDVALAIERTNREMAQLMGIEHLLLGGTGTGSLALIKGKLSSTFLIVSSTLGEVAEGVNRDLIAVVCSLNGIPKELWPKGRPEEIDVNDVEAVAQVLSALATAGAPLQPDDPAVDKVRGRVGLPPAPPPPELSADDQALVDRMRAGIPVNVAVPPQDPNAPPTDKPANGPAADPNKDKIKPGSGGTTAQRSQAAKALLKILGLAADQLED